MMHPVHHALTEGVPLLSGHDAARRFVLAHGRAYVPAPLPREIRRRKQGTCFKAAGSLVLRKQDAGLSYVEGFAINPAHPSPVWHAWLTTDGTAIDQVWPESVSMQSFYFGVEFSMATLAAMLLARGYYGLLDPVDDKLMASFEREAAFR